MSRSRYGSLRLRYLKARLSIFTRPSFLAGLFFLSAVGFVVKEYWTNPEFLKVSEFQESPLTSSSNSESSLSDEDRAIAADIGNLSILDFDKKQASISANTNTNINTKNQQQNQSQLNKVLELGKKNQEANAIKVNKIQAASSSTPSTSQSNPFLQQAKSLLKFDFNTIQQNSNLNNLSPFSNNLPTTQSSFSLGINNSFLNPSRNSNSESALQKAINQSSEEAQIQENSTGNTATEKNNSGQSNQTANTSPTNTRLLQSQTDSLVNTTIFNQPLNTQPQNTYSGFNNNQTTTNNFSQPGLNNQLQNQNPYNNFNNNQIPTNNLAQPGLNNPSQNQNGNFNNTQRPGNNFTQPNLYNNLNREPQQNPYSNFNQNTLPGNIYNQQNQTNSRQNNYNNFNNRVRRNGYNASTQRRLNNIYNRLTNRNNPNVVTPNNYSVPNNNINTGIQQPNIQQYNSPYSSQTPVQYPNNRYGY